MLAKLDLLVECLAATRIGKKGQLTLPKKYRDEMGLKAGDPIAMLRIGDGLILMPEQTRFRLLCGAISSALEGFNITEAVLQDTLPKARRHVFARRYPKLANKRKEKRRAAY